MSEWIEHDGLFLPEIEGLRCDIRLRDGTVLEDVNSYDWLHDWEWANLVRHRFEDRAPSARDIVAYRLTSDAPEAR